MAYDPPIRRTLVAASPIGGLSTNLRDAAGSKNVNERTRNPTFLSEKQGSHVTRATTSIAAATVARGVACALGAVLATAVVVVGAVVAAGLAVAVLSGGALRAVAMQVRRPVRAAAARRARSVPRYSSTV